ncbi:uncharacterized protein BCR38DRAFT_521334 [Pseudomassariella vexata]|uniref:Short chain dehydrogenase n=1 Tax=Pseudomassariella vexata TaxID=1141098 RepID=A0A1Y2E9G9_9PEZI|nr:uncharacterized protein BCR38DRAFT_521334 [Pseudomassariella vexata]ORY68228.1 hypothetical protein BCR38DRAFT_521334 [Pseudomassariella vexata]
METFRSPFSVSGRTAIVTGAGSGINLAFAKLLLSRNCNVVLVDLSLRPEAQAVIDSYSDHGKTPRAIFVKTDVSSWPALGHMFDATIADFGTFDIVCPGAGVYEPDWSSFWHPPGSPGSKDALDAGHYALLDINLTHPIRATQLAISHWLHPKTAQAKVSPSNPKRVIHISSIAAQVPNLNAPLYGASKSAISGLVRCLAPLEESDGIRVNAVAPGLIKTPLWTDNPDKLRYVDQQRDAWATPEEVAEAMLRCVEEVELVGGTVLEVGHEHTRRVLVTGDPGPDENPGKGLVAHKAHEGREVVKALLGNNNVWGPR